MDPFAPPDEHGFREGFPILTVGELVGALRSALGEMFPYAWVRGEISNFKQSRAGHMYFSLKDEYAQIACVCFRGTAARLPFVPEDGIAVLAGGEVEVYPDRGQLQIIVRQLEPEGTGALALAFEQLKAKLQAEGLFESEHKRELPPFPTGVGVVTSPTGSVIRDILNVSGRRSPATPIVLSPSRVQGEGAEHEIADAIDRLVARGGIDAIIVARGGGSLEDLWPFNTEVLARAVHACPLPVVSAVGHETDFTICDFVADLRAATPSAAAELVFPDRRELSRRVAALLAGLAGAADRRLDRERAKVDGLRARLRHPRRTLELQGQRLDDRRERLARAAHRHLERRRDRIGSLAARLDGASPLAVLARGYGLVLDDHGAPVGGVGKLAVGQSIQLKLRDGEADARIEELRPAKPGRRA